MIIQARVAVPGHLPPTIIGFQTKWSVNSFQCNMTSALRREFDCDIVNVEVLNADAVEGYFHDYSLTIYHSIDGAATSLFASVKKEPLVVKSYAFTYTIHGSGTSQGKALQDALESFRRVPGEPDSVVVEEE